MKFPIIPFEQPAGTFYLSAMSASDLIYISRADPRKYDAISMESVGGIQREASRPRIREIAEYADTIDAAFPTAILLAISKPDYTLLNKDIIINGEKVADIVDGQHRVLGLRESGNLNAFQIPIVFMLDATEEQKALIFATINGKQTKVPASLIYDLFDVTKTRSPQKTAHEIARASNSTKDSPWFRRLKMLGRKTPDSDESLSQGTFVKFLLPQISDDPTADRDMVKRGEKLLVRDTCIFNEYWRRDEDAIILKVLMNVFRGAKNVWAKEWDDPDQYVLTKSNGFTGIMKALPRIIEKGKTEHKLSADYFSSIFVKVDKSLKRDGLELTSTFFPTSAVGEAKFRDIIVNSIEN